MAARRREAILALALLIMSVRRECSSRVLIVTWINIAIGREREERVRVSCARPFGLFFFFSSSSSSSFLLLFFLFFFFLLLLLMMMMLLGSNIAIDVGFVLCWCCLWGCLCCCLPVSSCKAGRVVVAVLLQVLMSLTQYLTR